MTKKKKRIQSPAERKRERILIGLAEGEIERARAAAAPKITDRGETIDLMSDEYTETSSHRMIAKSK